MSVNLIICTYGAKYGVMDKKLYLKSSLLVLNNINTSVDRITIMKPKIDENHIPYENYYNFDDINISNIKDKIKIVECENIGISYGQFLTGIFNDITFNYYIFTEDDYLLFYDDFDIYLKNKVASLDSYLCVFYYKNKKWSLNEHLYDYRNNHFYGYRNNFINLNSYNEEIINKMNDYFYVPDHSCGIISNKTFKKILEKFGSLDNLLKLFNFKCDITDIWIYQVIFGYIFYLTNINIQDLSCDNLPLYYLTDKDISLFQPSHTVLTSDSLSDEPTDNIYLNICYNDTILNIESIDYFLDNTIDYCLDNPIFIPREFFYPYDKYYKIDNLKNYIKKFDKFLNQYNKLNLQIKNLITNHA